MSVKVETVVKEVCQQNDNDRGRLMDILRVAQERLGCVSSQVVDAIAKEVGMPRVEVASTASFYAFLSEQPKGKLVIRLCHDIIDRLQGADAVAKAFEEALGIRVGETTADGQFSLEHAPCIGMCDQAPAALVNDVVVTCLTPDKARQTVAQLKKNPDARLLVKEPGDGNNAHPLVQAMVKNHIRQSGPVIFDGMKSGEALEKALALSPAEVRRDVKTARLRGRGGAGFPTGMKWDFTRAAEGETRYIICNADEGEPGTFKDRVILTERPHLVFEGMTIGGYAIGASLGLVYLRAEYAYLRPFLEDVLAKRREAGLLGGNICGQQGFHFDIRIQMGAGAYICGEETALIGSCEGLRGDPKNRPPFPAQEGYRGCPTSVNNVETLCCVARILEKGPGWFTQLGSKGSSGTKVLSISGDCSKPGIYEVPFGIPVHKVLELAGASDAKAVQIGGPSGQMIGPADFSRTICYDDLPTGGSLMVFGSNRDVLGVVDNFMEFYVDESCGYCTPCRVGNVLLRQGLGKIIAGNGEPTDLNYLQDLAETVKTTSRCGLGQTSPNPILSTLKNFRPEYESRLGKPDSELQPNFDLAAAVGEAARIAGRNSDEPHP